MSEQEAFLQEDARAKEGHCMTDSPLEIKLGRRVRVDQGEDLYGSGEVVGIYGDLPAVGKIWIVLLDKMMESGHYAGQRAFVLPESMIEVF